MHHEDPQNLADPFTISEASSKVRTSTTTHCKVCRYKTISDVTMLTPLPSRHSRRWASGSGCILHRHLFEKADSKDRTAFKRFAAALLCHTETWSPMQSSDQDGYMCIPDSRCPLPTPNQKRTDSLTPHHDQAQTSEARVEFSRLWSTGLPMATLTAYLLSSWRSL